MKLNFHSRQCMLVSAAMLGAALSLPAAATGLATCDSGPKEGWQPQGKLETDLKSRGWQVRRIKVDGGCYEVYALNEKGERVEAYFHPVTLAPVPTKR
jgi:hypothetical protein